MFEIGRLCKKITGRDAEKIGIIVDQIDDRYVLLDGGVRRRKCNINHLVPLNQKIEIEKGASHEKVKEIFQQHNWEFRETKPKVKKEETPLK